MAASNKVEASQLLLNFLDVDYADYCTVLGVIADDDPVTNETVQLSRSVLHDLLTDGVICIGDAKAVDDKFEYISWDGTTKEKIERLDEVVSSLGASPGLWEGFWVWLLK